MSEDSDGDVDVSEAVRSAIVELENELGRLTPDDVITEAQKLDSPLHGRFEWDDEKASHSWRLEQARRLIRSVKVVVTTETHVIAVPRYTRDPEAGPAQGYVSLERLRSEPDAARAAVRLAFTQAAALLRRAEDLAEALGLSHKVQAVRRSIEALAKEVQQQQAPPPA